MNDPVYYQAPYSSADCRWLNESQFKPDYPIRLNRNEPEPIWLKREDSKDRLRTELVNKKEVWRETVLGAEILHTYDQIEGNKEEVWRETVLGAEILHTYDQIEGNKEEVWRETVLGAEILDTYDQIEEPKGGEKAIVRYSFYAKTDDELTLREGDIVSLTEQDMGTLWHNSGWWKGTVNGHTGVFPSNFVEIINFKDVQGPIFTRNNRSFTCRKTPLDDAETSTDETTLDAITGNDEISQPPPLPSRAVKSKDQPLKTHVTDVETRIYEIPPPPVPPRTVKTDSQPPAIPVYDDYTGTYEAHLDDAETSNVTDKIPPPPVPPRTVKTDSQPPAVPLRGIPPVELCRNKKTTASGKTGSHHSRFTDESEIGETYDDLCEESCNDQHIEIVECLDGQTDLNEINSLSKMPNGFLEQTSDVRLVISQLNDDSNILLKDSNAFISARNSETSIDTELKFAQCDRDVNKTINVSLKQKQKLHRYEEAAILFQRIIVNTVKVRQILPYLDTCIDHSDREHLRRLSENDQRSAATKLLELLHSSNEPGKWKALVEAFESTGHKLLVDVMRQNTIADNEEQIKILHMVSPQLRQQIKPAELIPYLKAEEIITGEDAEEILAKERNEGCIAAADFLIECIPRKHPKWFDLLLIAFSKCDRKDLKDILELEIENEIRSDTIEGLKHASNTRKMSDISTLTNRYTVINSAEEEDKETERENMKRDEKGQEREERKIIFDANQDETKMKICDNLESVTLESNLEAANFSGSGTDMEYSIPYSDDTKCRENECTNQHVVDKYNGTTSEETVIDLKQTGEVKTQERTPNSSHESLPKSTRKIGYTPVVINGVVCMADETKGSGKESYQQCVEVNKTAEEYIPELITELRKLKEDGCNEIQMLELEINERKVIRNVLDRKNQLLREKRVLLESFAIQMKEEAALKAAMSEEKKQRPERGSTYLEGIDIYRAPRNLSGKLTIEHRNSDINLFDPTLYEIENDQVVKIFNVASSCKDSAFYSDGNNYGLYMYADKKQVKPILFQ